MFFIPSSSSSLFKETLLFASISAIVLQIAAAGGICKSAPKCGLFGRQIHYFRKHHHHAGECVEKCSCFVGLSLLLGSECGPCPCVPDIPATETTRLFDQDIRPDATFGTGNANGAFTTVQTSDVELGIRAKTRYPSPKNPNDEVPGEGSQGDGTYKFPSGTFTVRGNERQLWAFDWHVNTDISTNGSPTSVPSDFTFEFGVDSDASAGTIFDQYDDIIGIPALLMSPRDHSFDTNSGSGDSGDTCTTNLATYQACLDTENVVQNSSQYAFLSALPGIMMNFDPNVDGNYVIYLRALKTDPICNEKYVVAEVYIEVLVGTGSALMSPPDLPPPL